MTLYWWTHWFWITASHQTAYCRLLLTLLLLQSGLHTVHGRPHELLPLRPPLADATIGDRRPFGLDTLPFHQPAAIADGSAFAATLGGSGRDQQQQREPLSFPRRAAVDANGAADDDDDDMEDVFDGQALVQASFREEWRGASRLAAAAGRPQRGGDVAAMAAPPPPITTAPAEPVASSTMQPETATRGPAMAVGSRTTVVPVADVIATRLSTRKAQRPAPYDASGTNVTRVNAALIRSNKMSSTNATTSTASSTAPNTTTISYNATAHALPEEEHDGDSHHNADVAASSASDSDTDRDDDRHNYTNELLLSGGKMSNEKASANVSGGRQSKVLAASDRTSNDGGDRLQEQPRSALEANLVNLTGGSKSLQVEIGAPMAMNAMAGEGASRALPVQRSAVLDVGAIAGIGVAALALCGAVGAGGVFLYRRRFVNKPQTLSEPDSASGYIDDSINRDNSDEMYSLDNDSFLNSLEAMTIQNYWTENVKHTKL